MEVDRRKQHLSAKKKNKNVEEYEDDNILQESIKIIDTLFDARLIEKISRPIDKKIREQIIDKYGMKLQLLHGKLKRIRADIIDMAYSDNGNPRNKSVFGEATSKPGEWRKHIRSIQSRYIDVLVDGSFKFFRKIVYSLGLTYSSSMELINIEEWAAACLDARSSDVCC